MIVVYFERRFWEGRKQGHLCGPAEWKDLVYGAHIVSMNDNGMQSNITRRRLSGAIVKRIAGAA